MVEAITATYVQEDDDWSITVAGLGRELSGRAPGIIAARDRADQLVEKLATEDAETTVVHLLDGSALAFTTAYMSARLARPVEQEQDAQDEAEAVTDEAEADQDGAGQDGSESARDEASEDEQAPAAAAPVPTKELGSDPAAEQQAPAEQAGTTS